VEARLLTSGQTADRTQLEFSKQRYRCIIEPRQRAVSHPRIVWRIS
jgi:hypothetical protein